MALTDPRPNPPAHVVRSSVEGTVAGVAFANVFWLRNGAGQTPGLGDLGAFATDLLQTYQSAFAAYMHSGVLIQDCSVIYYGPTGGDLGTEITSVAPGTGPGAGLPNNVATCISWKLQQRYRGGHPRTYLPPPGVDSMSDTRLFSAGHVDGVVIAANAFHAHMNAASHGALSDIHLGTVSFVHKNDWRDPPTFRDYISNAAHVDLRIDSMRRRLGPDLI